MTEQDFLRRETLLAAEASPEVRRDFIKRTYAHLGVAMLAFIGLEYLLVTSPLGMKIARVALLNGRFGWLLILVAFMAVGWLANKWARSGRSPGMQYLGLALYVVAEAVIFVPLLYLAVFYAPYEGLLGTAALITGVTFAGLTAIAFLSRADFSWMGKFLSAGFLVAFGVLAASLLFGFTLGTIYCGVVVLLAAGSILYQTSQVIHHYPVTSHVAASLGLFASIALLFWYVLQILMGSRR